MHTRIIKMLPGWIKPTLANGKGVDVIRASIVEIFIASIKTLDEMEINFRV